jgi:hypothetical protein
MAHYVLGSLEAAAGDMPAAIRHLGRYLELEPGGAQAASARERLERAREAAQRD